MPLKSTKSTKVEVYDFIMSHSDVIDMVNDPDVNFEEIGCPNRVRALAVPNQEFDIIIQKPDGGEFAAPFKMNFGDSLVVRYTQKRVNSDIQNLGNIDIDKCYENICAIPPEVKAVADSVLLCDGTRVLFNIPTATPTATLSPTPTLTQNYCITPTPTSPTATPTPTPTQNPSCANFTECGCTEPGPCASADCGLIGDPGFTYYYNCYICECVATPV